MLRVVAYCLLSISICSHVSGVSPPLSDNELEELEPDVREHVTHPKQTVSNSPHHTPRTSFKARYITNSGTIYTNVQVFQSAIKVEATQAVSDSTLFKAANIVAHMVKHMPSDIFSSIATHSHGVGIFTQSESLTVFPENYHLADSPACHGSCSGSCASSCSSDGRKYSEMAGVTNSRSVVLDKNVACTADDPYAHKENVLVHEFGHLILKFMPAQYRNRLHYVYNYAKTHNVWQNTYGLSNADEYWAEATSSFFMTITRDGPAAGMNKCNFVAICTSEQAARNWIQTHDPWLFDVLSTVYTGGHPTTPSGLRVCM